MTINDLGAEKIFEMDLFFPGNPCRIKYFLGMASHNLFFIFSWRVPFKIYLFLEKGLRILFFFPQFPRPPRSLMAVPLACWSKVGQWLAKALSNPGQRLAKG